MRTIRLQSRLRQDPGAKWARITLAILSTIGVIDTGSITLQRWGVVGSLSCPGGNQGCDQVLNSPWGTLGLGTFIQLPLSFIGLACYLAILVMAILPLLKSFSAETKLWVSKYSWQGLFVVSCCMASFSLVLLWLLVFKIQAFCFFCVLSAIISIGMLSVVFLGGNWDDPGKVMFRGILLSLIVLLGGFIWATSVDPAMPKSSINNAGMPPKVLAKSTPYSIYLAEHLTSTGAVMYSAYWCPHCHDQKELFGKEAASKLKIVECAVDGKNNQRDLCQRKGITGYPSWEINGDIQSGIISLDKLSKLSNYNGFKKF